MFNRWEGIELQIKAGRLKHYFPAVAFFCKSFRIAMMSKPTADRMPAMSSTTLLISPTVIEPIQTLKTAYLGSVNPRLHTDEVLIALSVSAATVSSSLTSVPTSSPVELRYTSQFLETEVGMKSPFVPISVVCVSLI